MQFCLCFCVLVASREFVRAQDLQDAGCLKIPWEQDDVFSAPMPRRRDEDCLESECLIQKLMDRAK